MMTESSLLSALMRHLPLGVLPVSLVLISGCEEKNEQKVSHARSEAIVATQGSAPAQKTAPAQSAASDGGFSAKKTAPPRGPLCNSKPNTQMPKKAVSGMGASTSPFAGGVPAKAGLTWVNLWAAWCEPCKKEIPILFGFQRELAKSGVEVELNFVSIDDDPRQLQRFLDAQASSGIAQTFWLKEGEERESWLPEAGLSPDPRLPVHLLVNRDGQIFCRIDGSIDAGDLDEVQEILKAALIASTTP